MVRSLLAKLSVLQLLKPQSIAADTNSASADLQNCNSASLKVSVGTFAFNATNKVALIVEESDDDVTFAPVAADALYMPEDGASGTQKILDAGTDDDQDYMIAYLGYKRYVRVKLDVSGTVAAILGVSVVKGHLEAMPPA